MRAIYFILPLLASAMSSSCATSATNTNETKVVKSYDLSGFDKISTATSVRLSYTAGNSTSVKVTAPDYVIPYLTVTCRGGSLAVKVDNRDNILKRHPIVDVDVTAPGVKSFEATTSSSITVTNPTLTIADDAEFEATTSGTIYVRSLQCRSVDIESTTSATISIDYIKCDNAEVEATTSSETRVGAISTDNIDSEATTSASIELSGINARTVSAETTTSATISLAGKTTSADFESSTSGRIKAEKLICDDAKAEAYTGGDVKMNAAQVRKQKAASGGKIKNVR